MLNQDVSASPQVKLAFQKSKQNYFPPRSEHEANVTLMQRVSKHD